MDGARVSRSLKRMAHQIVERNTEDKRIVLFGIDERGWVTANHLDDILGSMLGEKVTSLQLSLQKDIEPDYEETQSPEISDSFVIIVDDVIFTGQTMFTALKKISESINPSEIHTAVLVDRGHRKFPVQAEFCGMELPTKLNEHVSVAVEDAQIRQVSLVKKG